MKKEHLHFHINTKKLTKFLVVLAFIVLWSFLLVVIGPTTLIELIGPSNSLLVLFLIGTFGGVSTFTAGFFYSALISLVYTGFNPYVLGIVGGIAISIGDSLFYYLGHSGRQVLTPKSNKWTEQFNHWLSTIPKWLIPVVTFVYVGLTPLPNDVLTVSLGVAGIKYKRVIPSIIVGNIFLTTVIALIATSGFF